MYKLSKEEIPIEIIKYTALIERWSWAWFWLPMQLLHPGISVCITSFCNSHSSTWERESSKTEKPLAWDWPYGHNPEKTRATSEVSSQLTGLRKRHKMTFNYFSRHWHPALSKAHPRWKPKFVFIFFLWTDSWGLFFSCLLSSNGGFWFFLCMVFLMWPS